MKLKNNKTKILLLVRSTSSADFDIYQEQFQDFHRLIYPTERKPKVMLLIKVIFLLKNYILA